MNPTLSEIKTLIKYIKDKESLSQKDVAKKLGYHETYLSDVLNGQIKLSNKFIKRVREIYAEELEQHKGITQNAQIVQIQALLTSLQEDYCDAVARLEKTDPQTIQTRLMSRTIENLSKLITPKG